MSKDKFEAMEILNRHDIPCGPILSMKELANEPALRASGTPAMSPRSSCLILNGNGGWLRRPASQSCSSFSEYAMALLSG